MRFDEIHRRYGHNLPHWTAADATYFVTFRLIDSLPAAALDEWRRDIDRSVRSFEARVQREARPDELAKIRRQASKKIENLLDAGSGACVLAEPACAEIVRESLLCFHEDRYELGAWCVMPNHVHTLVKPRRDNRLEKIVGDWKGLTAKQLNRVLRLNGSRWQSEPFDHLVRDEGDHLRFTHYILPNPEKAELSNWPWYGIGDLKALAEELL